MANEHSRLVPCPEGCTVVLRESRWIGGNKRRDIDIYCFDVVDASGKVVSSHEVHDVTSRSPPYGRTISLYQ